MPDACTRARLPPEGKGLIFCAVPFFSILRTDSRRDGKDLAVVPAHTFVSTGTG